MPDLNFEVVDAEVLSFAAVLEPSVQATYRERGEEPIRSVALNTQIRIAATQRHYDAAEQEAVVVRRAAQVGRDAAEPALDPHRLQVQPFSGSTVVDMPVPCTYDLEVVAATSTCAG